MAKEERVAIIKEIQKKRNSHLISYITSTRQNLEVQMAMDSIRYIFNHIESIVSHDAKPNIDLFLHSNGGDGTVPWRLVTLIREYSKKFSVIIPHRAFSAATLTALGADSIVMHPMGMLGPTDPTVTNPFNPDGPAGTKIGISVEDVTAYIQLIKEDAGIQHEDELVQAFNHLANKVHPLALGNVKRSLSQSKMMATKLLSLHMDRVEKQHKINEIVDNLTSKLYYHGHPINRKEAKEQVGIPTIENPSKEIELLIWELYVEYEKEMNLDQPFDIAMEFIQHYPNSTPGQVKITPQNCAKLVFIESEFKTNVFSIDYQITGFKDNNGLVQTQLLMNRRSWNEE
ncbi:MAG: hypothetical protein WBK20_09770 [Spirochaetota bacterium]